MAKKIGIASPFKDYNYGTVLQAFALYESLRKLGVEAEYLNYSSSASLPRWKRIARYLLHPSLINERLRTKRMVNQIVAFLNSEEFMANKVKYDQFIRMIPCSVPYDINTIKNANSQYDLFVVGSDQTWSPFLNDSSSIYFLNFAENFKKTSYASSLGTTDISEDYKRILKEKLASFKHLSCREEFGAEMLSELTGKKVEHVLDPTLLLCAKEWEVYEQPVRGVPEKYILVYQLGSRPELKIYADVLSSKQGIPVISILTNANTKEWDTTVDGIGPSEFLWLIHHATYIVTDSFHGTMFSINYQKQFFSFTKVEGGSGSFDNIRLEDVLSCFEMANRLITDKNVLPNDIDYRKVSDTLETRRDTSKIYLKSAVCNTYDNQ